MGRRPLRLPQAGRGRGDGLAGLANPYALALGGPNGRLYVAEADAGAVEEYDPATQTLARERFGASEPGPVRFDEFRWPIWQEASIAVDGAGVLGLTDVGNRRVQWINDDGTLHRSDNSGPFNPRPYVDPEPPNVLMSGPFQYTVDYTEGPTYGDWELTHNWALTADESLSLRHRIDGNDYLFVLSRDWPRDLDIYAIDGDTIRPAASLRMDGHRADWGIWTDTDGDGQEDPGETRKDDGNVWPTLGPGWVDGDGNVYYPAVNGRGSPYDNVAKLPLLGFDAAGNPLYDYDTLEYLPTADASDMGFEPNHRQVRIDADTGDIYELGTVAGNRDPSGWGGQRRPVNGLDIRRALGAGRGRLGTGADLRVRVFAENAAGGHLQHELHQRGHLVDPPGRQGH